MASGVGLLSLSIMFSGWHHCSEHQCFIPFNAEFVSMVWTDHVCLSIHPSMMHSWVVSAACLLWRMLLWTFMDRVLCGRNFSFLFYLYLVVDLTAHGAPLCLPFWRTVDCFPTLPAKYEYPSVSTSLPLAQFSSFYFFAEILYFSICFRRICNLHWKHFYDCCVKILVR